MANDRHDEHQIVNVDGPTSSRHKLASIALVVLKRSIVAGLGMARLVIQAMPQKRQLSLAGLSHAELIELVKSRSASALASRAMPQGKAGTRSLMRSLHAAALANEASGKDSRTDYAGLIVAIAFQCSQVQGSHGDGIDGSALAWANAKLAAGR